MGIAQIRFTPATVREVSARVSEFTEGRFALRDVGDHPYLDRHSDLVWIGALGARQACAYLVGGALATARMEGRAIPQVDAEFLMWVRAGYLDAPATHRQDLFNWETVGAIRAGLLA